MGRKKSEYKPGRFESTGEKGETFTTVYGSMMKSAAFKDLTKNQRLLYIYLKMQRFGKRKPRNVYKDTEAFQDDLMIFFSMGDAERADLYTRNNEKSFRADMKALIEHGFIKLIMSGKNQKVKSIYKLVGDWQDWKPG